MGIETGETTSCGEPRPLLVAVVVGAADLERASLPADLRRLISEVATVTAEPLRFVGDAAVATARLDAAVRAAGAPAAGAATAPAGTGLAAIGRDAVARRCDLLVIDGDAVPCVGAFAAMRDVAADDPMTGFVVARGDRRGRYRLPAFADRAGTPADLDRVAQRFGARLDGWRRVPALDGPCLLIRWPVLAGFADLDAVEPVFGADFLVRARRVGFGIALAERAWVTTRRREADAAFALPIETWHGAVLAARPELAGAIAAPAGPARRRAEALWPALVDEPRGLAIDAGGIARSFNGTTVLLRRLLPPLVAAAADRFAVTLVGDVEILRHHGFDRIAGLALMARAEAVARGFAIGFRVGQPYDFATVADLAGLGVADVWFMLDTISIDCVQLHSGELERLWAFVMGTARGVVFNSDLTGAQYRRRFEIGARTRTLVSHHSLRPSDYRLVEPTAAGDGSVLIVGNRFPHKFVAETYARLKALLPQRRFVVLGDGAAAVAAGDRAIASGRLGPEAIGGLYAAAEVVVFPSFYEGFGFPILEALAHRRPVFARDGRLGREIRAGTGSANLHLYEGEADIAAALAGGVGWVEEAEASDHDWAASAAEILAFLDGLVDDARHADVERRFVELDRLRAELDALATADTSDRRRIDLIAEGLGLALGRARLMRALSVVAPGARAVWRAKVEDLKALVARFRDR